MSDLINREQAMESVARHYHQETGCEGGWFAYKAIADIPSADTDISEYSDKLWKNAYERGKADRPQGEWIDKGRNLWKCSNCEMVIYSESEQDRNEFHKWCSRCGCRMKGADDETY